LTIKRATSTTRRRPSHARKRGEDRLQVPGAERRDLRAVAVRGGREETEDHPESDLFHYDSEYDPKNLQRWEIKAKNGKSLRPMMKGPAFSVRLAYKKGLLPNRIRYP